MKVQLYFLYPKYKKEIYETLKLLIKEYPIIQDNIKIIKTKIPKRNKKCFASQYFVYDKKIQSIIKLNPKAFCFPFIKRKFKETQNANYYSVQDIICHEVGHCLQLYILCKKYNLNLNTYNYSERNKFYDILEDDNKKLECFNEHMFSYFKRFNWNKQIASYYLGKYAIYNPEEFIPECFNNYYRLKNQTNLDTKQFILFNFVKTVIEEYQEFIPKQDF